MSAPKNLIKMVIAPGNKWDIDSLKQVAAHYNISYDSGKGSHTIFFQTDREHDHITIPSHGEVDKHVIEGFVYYVLKNAPEAMAYCNEHLTHHDERVKLQKLTNKPPHGYSAYSVGRPGGASR